MTHPVFSSAEVVAEAVSRRVEGRHVLLLTDFDGTLVDLTPTRDEAAMRRAIASELAALTSLESMTTGLVSGRRAWVARARTSAATEFVAGLHGHEILLGPEPVFTHPALAQSAPVIRALTARARNALAWCDGLVLEDRDFALACHVRNVPPVHAARALAQFVGLAVADVSAGRLRILQGDRSTEVLAATDWDPGRAVAWLRSRVGELFDRPALVWLSDDRTEGDSFASREDGDCTIGVGEGPVTSLVDWRLAGPASVWRFFALLRASHRR